MAPFKFKQFVIHQEQCAMKIGTDAVLLGAWTSLSFNPFSILDIGTGTGILSLMLAQRSNAEIIDALEIDDAAYEQCVDNFELSAWADRLFCYHASLEEFTDEIEEQYDLIISNPPFYIPSLPSASRIKDGKKLESSRETARFQDAMPFEHLIKSVSKLLSEIGEFSVIIPFQEEETFINLAASYALFPSRLTHVQGNPKSEIKRSLITFTRNHTEVKKSHLIIETERHKYTDDYVTLTKDFYLKM
ncbi:methyltransferase domain-containing protein [Bizionia argentinensis JUB59]|uniref:tRNA1(Val) (adenine(37)-N6)-methyltransferase n=1 Tax=Bizionia argentinensis JUB59 TaxID=1046627 RepID=G2EHI9_9FLAO|nr:methyltransferase [Bizionia argentinensis]EGV42123.1 methyltransferase domain-containing protein [Bizionia argentinensis JUB59]